MKDKTKIRVAYGVAVVSMAIAGFAMHIAQDQMTHWRILRTDHACLEAAVSTALDFPRGWIDITDPITYSHDVRQVIIDTMVKYNKAARSAENSANAMVDVYDECVSMGRSSWQ